MASDESHPIEGVDNSNASHPVGAPRHRLPVVRRLLAMSHSLGWRVVVFLSASLLLLLGASGFFALRLHRQHLVEALQEAAVGVGETILASTHASMLENDREHLAQIVEILGSRERVTAVRLINASGTVSFSSRPDEAGSVADVTEPACAGCHASGTPKAPSKLRDGLHFYPMRGGTHAMGLAVPVLNAPECWSANCHVHPQSQRVLGLLDVELSMKELEAAMATAQRQMVLLFGGSILVICTIAGLLTWRVVHEPIVALLRGTRQLAEGDLTHRIPAPPPGEASEIGELAQSFNDMAHSLEQAHAELDQWSRTLEARVAEKSHELERARDQMVFAEKMASLGKMAAVVAHEINNPLAGILVSAKLVRRQLPRLCAKGQGEGPIGTSGMDETLAMIEREAARCGDIARNLLLFSRRRDLSATAEDVNELVRRSLKLLHHQTEMQEIAVREQLDASAPQIVCDAGQIEQAVVALIMNAIEAMPDGGELTVKTSATTTPPGVRIEVTDTGAGIPPQLRDRIFEPFFSTKKQGQGTGLGLAVLYGIVQRHQGSVEVISPPEGGATFVIQLPVTPAVGVGQPEAEIAQGPKGV